MDVVVKEPERGCERAMAQGTGVLRRTGRGSVRNAILPEPTASKYGYDLTRFRWMRVAGSVDCLRAEAIAVAHNPWTSPGTAGSTRTSRPLRRHPTRSIWSGSTTAGGFEQVFIDGAP
jgi:hypothetical protein